MAVQWLFAKFRERKLDHQKTYDRSYVLRDEFEFFVDESDNGSDVNCVRPVPLSVQLDAANLRLNALSYIEVEEMALLSNARYLIFKCDDGNCITTHSQTCKLSGISVSKANENKVNTPSTNEEWSVI